MTSTTSASAASGRARSEIARRHQTCRLGRREGHRPQLTRVAAQLKGKQAFFAVPSDELLAGDESYEVEFKSTARWNLRDGCKDKRMEDAVVKTVAAFLNTDGGTLFIGVDDHRVPVGLGYDTAVVKPQNADGFVNWLTTNLSGALGNVPVMRTRARVEVTGDVKICRVDVAASSAPVTARMSDKAFVFGCG